MIVWLTYAIVAASICCAAFYLILRLRLYITVSSLLLGFLLLVYGPAYLIFMLFRAPAFYARIVHDVNFPPTAVSLNLAISLMFLCVPMGFELVGRMKPGALRVLNLALEGWNTQKVGPEGGRSKLLVLVLLLTSLFMATTSLKEHHLSVIAGYLALSGSEFDKIAYRHEFAGSQSYLYRVLVGSIAPVLVIWGGIAGRVSGWRPLVAAAVVLGLLTLVGKIDTLSKGPIALFAIQLMLVAYLLYRNDITWRMCLVGIIAASAIFYPIVRIAVPEVEGWDALNFLYYRIFENSNESLLEYFATFPRWVAHGWGSNIRPIALLLGREYLPSYLEVLRRWHGDGGSSVTAMFIADAWVDFSYLGVVLFSVAAGAICRMIDIVFLSRGKTAVSLAVLAGGFIGTYNLMIAALPTALLSGGLLSAPLLLALILRFQARLRSNDLKPATAAAGEPDD